MCFHTKLPSSCLFIPSCHMFQRRKALITAVTEAPPCLQSKAEPFQKKELVLSLLSLTAKNSVSSKCCTQRTRKFIQFYKMEKRSTEGLSGCFFLWLSMPACKWLNSNMEQFLGAIFKQWDKYMLERVQLMSKRGEKKYKHLRSWKLIPHINIRKEEVK